MAVAVAHYVLLRPLAVLTCSSGPTEVQAWLLTSTLYPNATVDLKVWDDELRSPVHLPFTKCEGGGQQQHGTVKAVRAGPL